MHSENDLIREFYSEFSWRYNQYGSNDLMMLRIMSEVCELIVKLFIASDFT